MSSAGMDASAQTGSHELTIPNDVSHVYLLLLFYCLFFLSLLYLPSGIEGVDVLSRFLLLSAHWLHHWPSGRKDQ